MSETIFPVYFGTKTMERETPKIFLGKLICISKLVNHFSQYNN